MNFWQEKGPRIGDVKIARGKKVVLPIDLSLSFQSSPRDTYLVLRHYTFPIIYLLFCIISQ